MEIVYPRVLRNINQTSLHLSPFTQNEFYCRVVASQQLSPQLSENASASVLDVEHHKI